MPRNFLKSLVGLVFLATLVLLTTLNVWQSNRIERNQLDLSKRVVKIEKAIENGSFASSGSSGPSGGIYGVAEPEYITTALQDPKNKLTRDSSNWLPSDAKQGGTLHLKFGSDPKGFNFVAENGADVSEIQAYVLVQLARRHMKDTTRWKGDLAYHLDLDDEKKVYTFKIREDVFWHKPILESDADTYGWLDEGTTCREGHFENGRCRVTAHDLVFMLDMLMNEQVAGAAPLRSYFEKLEGYEAVDDFTFRIRFSKGEYFQDLIARELYPMAEHVYAYDEEGTRYPDEILGQRFEEHWYNPNALGAGPYRFIRFEPGVAIELERDPRFPMGSNAFDKIVFSILKDQNQPPRKLRTKELHLSTLQPSQYRAEVLEGKEDSPFLNGQLEGGEYWEHTYFYIGWNADRPWFGDKRVRLALSYAFAADRLLNEVFLGLGERCTGPMPAYLPFYDKSLPPIPFDLEKAGQLLDEAGWTDSDGDGIRDKEVNGDRIPFEFKLMVYGSSDEYKTLGNIYKEDLAKIGVKMQVSPMEWANLLKKVDDREFDAVTLAWVSSPDVDFYQIWHSSQADIPKGSNRVGFRNAEADVIIEALKGEFDFDARVKLAHAFHQLTYEEQPYTFFYTRKRKVYWQATLDNVWFQMTRPYMNPRPWYFSAPAL